MKTKLTALLLALAMVCFLAACGTTEGVGQGESAETFLFVDDAGREVEIPVGVERIVPSAALSQIILMAAAPDLFVGAADRLPESGRGIISDALYDLPYLGNLSGGADVNVEELALAGPQLIIDLGEPRESVKENLDDLQARTLIPSVYLSVTLESMPETYRKLGRLLGREERCEDLARFCERVYDRTLSVMEQVGENKVNCLYVLGEDGLNVIAATSYHAELLDLLTNNLAVVDNPLAKGTGNEVTMEQIALWNPDFVLFAPGSIYQTVTERDPWNRITAIVNGEYVEVPEAPHNWLGMPPSVQRYLGLIWLTAVLYPDYCDYDVKAEIMEYYELFYGCTLTDERYDAMAANAFVR